ncbi:MBL fold metallo-hydrolase [Cellulomonas cellasea]|uniref:MBL fold metallo-hydrolase n=1 Tax=Cellulomonas cellasea TaxID=43670 RepID=UPI0025A4B7BB|nr:MBL fold metallo-hydrolase [Cellulomonas cellasea]MDM8084077.1 MBL fold metallo-hydrolase [Cellulomonas cellasea]
MAYTGVASPGGPADVRELDALTIRKASVGPMDNNAYLLTCRRTGAQLLVDAAADADRLLELIREGSPQARLDAVVTTHRHRDHIGALTSILAVTGARALAGADDAQAIGEAADVHVEGRVHHGATVPLGDLALEVIALRGHTPGSIALAYREPRDARAPEAVPGRTHLFTGDSLFPGGPGRTSGGDDFDSLMDDLQRRVFDTLPDDTWVYPGHGRDTTLGAERPHLEEWRARRW